MTLEGARGGKLAELVSDHFFGAVHGNVLSAVVNGNRAADELGEYRGGARPGLDDLLVVGLCLSLYSRTIFLLHKVLF